MLGDMGGLFITCRLLLSFLVALPTREKLFMILARRLFLIPRNIKLDNSREEPEKEKEVKVDPGRMIPYYRCFSVNFTFQKICYCFRNEHYKMKENYIK
jgi:hypothetical protein